MGPIREGVAGPCISCVHQTARVVPYGVRHAFVGVGRVTRFQHGIVRECILVARPQFVNVQWVAGFNNPITQGPLGMVQPIFEADRSDDVQRILACRLGSPPKGKE